MKKFLLFFISVIILNVSAADNTADKKEQSIVERYNDILNYGIEREVIDILSLLGTNPKKEFLTIVFERYKSSTLVDSKIQYIGFFANCENLFEEIKTALYNEAKDAPDNVRLHSKLLFFISRKGTTEQQLLLIERLSSYEESIKAAAAESLSEITNTELGKPLLERLEISDKDSEKYLSNDIKAKLVLGLGKMKSKETLSYLRNTISESANDKMIVMYGMVALAEMKDIESIGIIRKNLASEEPKIKEYAAYSISIYEAKEVLPVLREMLKNDNDKVRIYACQGILLNKDIESVKLLMYKFKNDPSFAVKKEALGALIGLGIPGINTVDAYMKEKDFSESELAVLSEAVRKKPADESVSFVLSLYEKADKKKKEVILKNMLFGTSNKLDRFIDVVLKSEDPYVRINAIKTIYQTKDSTLWARVIELSEKDPSESVKKFAKNYLELRTK